MQASFPLSTHTMPNRALFSRAMICYTGCGFTVSGDAVQVRKQEVLVSGHSVAAQVAGYRWIPQLSADRLGKITITIDT